MKSIRRRLTLAFLAGIGLLGIGAGAAVYLSCRAGLMAGFETELQTLCRQVRTVGSMGGGGGPRRGGPWRSFDPEVMNELGPDVFWQVRRLENDQTFRSDNLEGDLPWPGDGRPEAWRDVVASMERMENVVQSMLQLARACAEAMGYCLEAERHLGGVLEIQ